jgi:GT2 family glycosyltransferase
VTVSVIIPFRDQADLLRRCVDSLVHTAGEVRWEALLVDNRSWEPETRAVTRHLASHPRCRLLSYPREFNWAAINNWAVRQCGGEILLFLNNDIEATREGWMEAMLEHAARSEVGAVGARLLYPTGHVQHAGVIVGPGGVAGHACRFCPADHPGYFGITKVIRNYSAVTGACMMVRRSVYEEVSGFDEELAVAYNDIDFCLKIRQLGYRIVYTPFAELIHYESVSRGISTDRPEARRMALRWAEVVRNDPFYHPHLSRWREDFALARKGEVDPWTLLQSSTPAG